MDDLHKRLNEKITYLYEILEKYYDLNRKTNYRFDLRARTIEYQIDILIELRDNTESKCGECFEKDFNKSKNIIANLDKLI
jgi:hypothetical protein